MENKTVKQFFDKNNYPQFATYRIKTREQINPILEGCVVFGKGYVKNVSVGDIIGYNYNTYDLTDNIATNLGYFFDEAGTDYQKRSVGMLNLPREEFLEKMKEVCKDDTMCLTECDDNKFVISNNGLHRFNVLRVHYLNELSRLKENTPENIQNLKKKYELSAYVTPIDYTKTYASYFLNLLNPEFKLKPIFDDNWNITNKSQLMYNGKSKVLSDDDLIDFLRTFIFKYKNNIGSNIDQYNECYNKVKSFKRFVDDNSLNLTGFGVDLW